MIVGFRHRGLRRLFNNGDRTRISPQIIAKVERVLARLDVAAGPSDMNLPGFGLHSLKGDLAGVWSVTITGNWRIVFRFEGPDVRDVDLIDYH